MPLRPQTVKHIHHQIFILNRLTNGSQLICQMLGQTQVFRNRFVPFLKRKQLKPIMGRIGKGLLKKNLTRMLSNLTRSRKPNNKRKNGLSKSSSQHAHKCLISLVPHKVVGIRSRSDHKRNHCRNNIIINKSGMTGSRRSAGGRRRRTQMSSIDKTAKGLANQRRLNLTFPRKIVVSESLT